MRNIEVIKAFASGKSAKSSNNNLRTDGKYLVNYSTVLAYNVNGGIAYNTRKYSVTTSKIQSYIKRICNIVEEYEGETRY